MHDGKGVDGELAIVDRARKCLLNDLATTGGKQRGLLGNLGRRALLAGTDRGTSRELLQLNLFGRLFGALTVQHPRYTTLNLSPKLTITYALPG